MSNNEKSVNERIENKMSKMIADRRDARDLIALAAKEAGLDVEDTHTIAFGEWRVFCVEGTFRLRFCNVTSDDCDYGESFKSRNIEKITDGWSMKPTTLSNLMERIRDDVLT